MRKENSFSRPVLSSLFLVVGAINALSLILISIGPLWRERGVAGLLLGSLAAFVSLLCFYGLAQLIEYVAKTAYYAELTFKAVTDSLVKDVAACKTAMRNQTVNTAKPIGKPHDIPSPDEGEAQEIPCPKCGAPILSSEIETGLDYCPECGEKFKVEAED